MTKVEKSLQVGQKVGKWKKGAGIGYLCLVEGTLALNLER